MDFRIGARAEPGGRTFLRAEGLPESGGPVCILGQPTLNPSVWAKEVPPSIVHQLANAKSILIVGDGDADGIGSAVGLARGLSLLGMHAVAYSATPAPIELQGLLNDGELETGPIDQTYDLVIHVDQYGDRAGDAATEAARRAKAVIVIDHHDVAPNPAYHSWIDTGADAAALLALGLVIRMAARQKVSLSSDDWKRVLTPIVAGIRSDTRGFSDRSTRPSTYGILEFVKKHTSVDLAAIARAADPFSEELKQRIRDVLEVRFAGEAPHRTAIFSLSKTEYARILEEATLEHNRATEPDVYRAVLGVIEDRIEAESTDASIALIDRIDFIKVSTRSRSGGHATKLARAFGGNGKTHEGGANLYGPALVDALAQAEKVLEAWRTEDAHIVQELRTHVSQWRRGSL